MADSPGQPDDGSSVHLIGGGSVSRGTIRQAFAALRADGVIASRCGASWVVVGGPIPQVQRRWAGVYSEVDPGMAARGRTCR